mmetsp:Transcript_23994/g.66489  ORF Transcript_23994/g.66489 Transcript_23994/m.66489 type:complete len:848 (-) Transcript_23994:674-3217(-)
MAGQTATTMAMATACSVEPTPSASANPPMNGTVDKITGTKPKSWAGSALASRVSTAFRLLGFVLRWILLDASLVALFVMLVFVLVVHRLHDDYLHPQLQLMMFKPENRQYTDATYYQRVCEVEDFSTDSVEDLMIRDDFSTEDCAHHMLTHGVSVYPDLLTNETATELRDWIARENYMRESWNVIENQHRFTWGIDVNMHPKLQTYWQELAANDRFRKGLEAIVGPDPAVIEFTAITSSYGASDQYMHADVIPHASATKYSRSFVPSYSLFIPLQDTTYEMGATHVCPGTHQCSEADEICNEYGALAVSGDDGGFWKMGHGALVNQQTYHRGMGFTQEGAPDRVVLIATFAPRPNYQHGMETRQIGQGGSYSLLWNQWGHTFSDFVHSDKRMTEPQKTLRSLGLIKGKGWNYLSSLSMRMANEDTDMRSDSLEELLEEEDGLWFLPRSWQDNPEEDSDISDWHGFAIGCVKRVEAELGRFYAMGLGAYVSVFCVLVVLQRALGIGEASRRSKWSTVLRFLLRLVATHGVVVAMAWFALKTVDDSSWAKAIRNRKLYRIPVTDVKDPAPSTIPHKSDVLFVPHYTSDYLASYARVVDVVHPGNRYWKEITKEYAALYDGMTADMQTVFCASLLSEITRERRFLKQDEERFWTEVVDPLELVTACHRELTTAFDPLLETMVRQVAALQSETIFGKFRGTKMQKEIMPAYLRRWDERFFETSLLKKKLTTPAFVTQQKQAAKTAKLQHPMVSRTLVASSPTTRTASSAPLRNPTLPPQPEREEPEDGVWLKEGDRAEGLWRCEDEGNWFPGTITAAIGNEGTYDILYDDGDTDEGLSDECVRRLDDVEDE